MFLFVDFVVIFDWLDEEICLFMIFVGIVGLFLMGGGCYWFVVDWLFGSDVLFDVLVLLFDECDVIICVCVGVLIVLSDFVWLFYFYLYSWMVDWLCYGCVFFVGDVVYVYSLVGV